ncbi:uncharacterized protein LOC135479600 [Liolophura sinensis]|uniref:uncharacterized protein LOC135479600 n=1 Tax=Liolophura sinensis TaxID=3198878 RepID=UPI0031591AB2
MSKPNTKTRTLTKEETDDYLAAFNAFKGDDNSLDSREFICILVALGVEGGEERAQTILRKINKNQDAKITKNEYLEAIKQPGINNSQIQRLKEVFDKFDHDNDGWASNTDVINKLPDLGLTEAEVKKQIEELDENRDGKIVFEDFLRVQLRIWQK